MLGDVANTRGLREIQKLRQRWRPEQGRSERHSHITLHRPDRRSGRTNIFRLSRRGDLVTPPESANDHEALHMYSLIDILMYQGKTLLSATGRSLARQPAAAQVVPGPVARQLAGHSRGIVYRITHLGGTQARREP
jgi:hypothetical protein